MFGSTASTGNKLGQTPKPHIRKLSTVDTPASLFLKIRNSFSHAFLLESMQGPRKEPCFSFIGFSPYILLSVKNGRGQITYPISKIKEQIKVDNPLTVLRKLLATYRENDARQRYLGGAVGYISYDITRYWEHLHKNTIDDFHFPDIEMGIYDDGIVFDHSKKYTYYFYRSRNRISEIDEVISKPCHLGELSHSSPVTNISRKHYYKLIGHIKEYISAGDIFQAVLSRRFDFRIKGDLGRFYVELRKINPSPYMYYLKMDDKEIIGSSPEMLARVTGRRLETYPIAGTRPYVASKEQNLKLASEMLADPKERAEHVMLVDLARNDVGKVAKFGTVKVPTFMQVHQYSHVQHIVSKVTGELQAQRDCFDAFQAVFPAGTVSGAPKIRAMEIIEECEPTCRGPYAGAVGYFSFNGNMDFAITIRTLIAQGEKGYIQAGGGIVADSEAENEWLETAHKARALLSALKQTE
ncbi:MAG: anthranilate synthase component I family protein [Candidatus Ranarchaeia archaeon]